MMDDFLDEEIGENVKLLPDLLRGLKKKEDLLQGQVCSLPTCKQAIMLVIDK